MSKKAWFIFVAIFALALVLLLPISWALVVASFFYVFDEKNVFWVWGILYAFFGIFSPLVSFISVKGLEADKVYTKFGNVILLVINILVILASIGVVIYNQGVLPKFP